MSELGAPHHDSAGSAMHMGTLLLHDLCAGS
jgi:hypothetical protein